MLLLTAILTLLLALVHLLSGRLRFLDVIPRSRWLSGSSGISIAYVFVHIFPELSVYQATLESHLKSAAFVDVHVYLIALLGLGVFYGLDAVAVQSKARQKVTEGEATLSPAVFWLHVTSFTAYNALIGYLLVHREKPGLVSLLVFFAAMAAHFLVNDYGLRHDYTKRYHDIGRWLLAAGVFLGWGVGWLTTVSDVPIALLFSFLAGGIILNVLKEELPRERQSRFGPFALGAVAFAALLLFA